MIHEYSQNERANTPLMIASQEGNMATCALLIKRGAVVDYQNKVMPCIHGVCALMFYCIIRHGFHSIRLFIVPA